MRGASMGSCESVPRQGGSAALPAPYACLPWRLHCSPAAEISYGARTTLMRWWLVDFPTWFLTLPSDACCELHTTAELQSVISDAS